MEPKPWKLISTFSDHPWMKQATDFLEAHGLQFQTVNRHDDKCPIWPSAYGSHPNACHCGQTHGDHFRVTISGKDRGRLTFSYWNSLYNKQVGKDLTPYNVLASLGSDINCPNVFADFCNIYGVERNSRKAYLLFTRCARFGKRLRAFFTEKEREELQKIQ